MIANAARAAAPMAKPLPMAAVVLPSSSSESVHVKVDWQSHYTVHRIEVVLNGSVVASNIAGETSGTFEVDVPIGTDGWIAARAGSAERDSFNQPIWAHTSPVDLEGFGNPPETRSASARYFDHRIDEAVEWVRKKGKFYNDGQRKEVVDLHRSGQEFYKKLLR